ncbi:C39 family peptidase [Candidatus Woesearchaeota archaeon]|nr:C39 family peptidase [Candidatus Woesearchaeota archaeon]
MEQSFSRKLEVPVVFQPEGTKYCGPAGLSMIFKYYGLNIPFEQIIKDLEVDTVGTYAPQLGLYLIKHGFDIEIITLHPTLFTKNDYLMNQEEILLRIEDLFNKTKLEQNKKTLNYFIEFLKSGGKIKVKIPSKEDIIEEIKYNRPITALMTTNFLNYNEPKFNFHFNVITGIDNEFVYVNDPWPDNTNGKKKHKINEFFYGIYASAYADLDNACLIKIKKN